MSGTATATVETLTAEVRVLMVGNRQITSSVAKQLDRVRVNELEPYGRVKLPGDDVDDLGFRVIGRHRETGALVIAWFYSSRFTGARHVPTEEYGKYRVATEHEARAMIDRARELEAMPLIVLAGLR